VTKLLPGGGISQFDQQFHTHDFVYVKPGAKHSRLEIAQITKIKAKDNLAHVSVNFFGRCHDFICEGSTGSTLVLDEVRFLMDEYHKCLICQPQRQLYKIPHSTIIGSDEIDGKCYVLHLTTSHLIDEWVSHDDHYYVNQYLSARDTLSPLHAEEFQKCDSCCHERKSLLRRNARLLRRHQPLRGLELFSGMHFLPDARDVGLMLSRGRWIGYRPRHVRFR